MRGPAKVAQTLMPTTHSPEVCEPQSVTFAHLVPHSEIEQLIDPSLADTDGTNTLSEYQFTRTPLVVNVTLGANKLQIIFMHTKSNFVNNGKAIWNNSMQRQNYIEIALKARPRNATEAMRLRRYLNSALGADPAAPIMVMSDLNDGPAMDYFEEHYLAHKVTDILVGSAFEPETIFGHAQHDVAVAQRYTAAFEDFLESIPLKKMLLDHISLSSALNTAGGLKELPGSGCIHYAEYAAEVSGGGAHREDRPSDPPPCERPADLLNPVLTSGDAVFRIF
jgi:hypothetical protein